MAWVKISSLDLLILGPPLSGISRSFPVVKPVVKAGAWSIAPFNLWLFILEKENIRVAILKAFAEIWSESVRRCAVALLETLLLNLSYEYPVVSYQSVANMTHCPLSRNSDSQHHLKCPVPFLCPHYGHGPGFKLLPQVIHRYLLGWRTHEHNRALSERVLIYDQLYDS